MRVFVLILVTMVSSSVTRGIQRNGFSSLEGLIHKKSFSELGCMGVYDKAKFARLDRVCEECYQLYREADVHTFCRENCFKNSYFTQCVDALLLQKDHQLLDAMRDELYGRK